MPGLAFQRLLSRADLRPAEAVRWAHRDLVLGGAGGRGLRDVEVPQDWSVEASLAFLVQYAGVDQEEWPEGVDEPLSVRRSLDARLEQVRRWAIEQQYFSRDEDAEVFVDELAVLLLTQGAAYADGAPGGEAWRWDGERNAPARTEVEENDRLREQARVLTTLEQAEVRSLLERCAKGEEQAQQQAANTVVLLTDALMLSAEHAVGGRTTPELLALLTRAMAQSQGLAVSFARNVERWNPTPETSTVATLIEASPCAATLDLMRFVDAGGELDLPALRHAAAVMTTALEIEVDRRAYRSEATALEMHRHRPLALGFSNLGVLLMGGGLAYDSPSARRLSAAVASLILGEAIMQSARMAETCAPLRGAELMEQRRDPAVPGVDGACAVFVAEPERFLAVVRQQRAETYRIVREADHGGAAPVRDGVIPIRPERSPEEPALLRQLPEIVNVARAAWDAALTHGERFGYRNAQWTALLPRTTGAGMLDAETAGLEPVPALLLTERRNGGGDAGEMRVRQAVAAGLFRLSYTGVESEAILQHLEAGGSLANAPFLRDADRAVFFCSGAETERPRREAELQMLSAVQPFLSAANPQDLKIGETSTSEAVAAVLLEAWRTGVKALRIVSLGAGALQAGEERESSSGAALTPSVDAQQAVMGGPVTSGPATEQAPAAEAVTVPPKKREAEAGGETGRLLDGTQTLAEAEKALLAREQAALVEVQLQRIADLEVQVLELQQAATANADAPDAKEPPRSVRNRLPAERASVTHKFSIGDQEGYITVGLYPNGSPGEIFLRMSRESSSVSGLLNSFAITVSLALQHGVPLHSLTEHLAELRFEPSGETGNTEIPHARSIMHYLFEWMERRFLTGDQMDLFRGMRPAADDAVPVTGDVHGASSRVTPRVSGARRP